MTKITSVLVSIATLAFLANAAPTELEPRGGSGGVFCTQYTSYDITGQTVSYETPVLISGGQVAADPAGGSITSGYTYSKSVGFIGGIQATWNYEKLFTFGATAQATVTYTSGTDVSYTVNCPDNVTCGLTASAEVLTVTGTQTNHFCDSPTAGPGCKAPISLSACEAGRSGGPWETPVAFTATYPIVDPNSVVNGQDSLVTKWSACAVGTPTGGLPACPKLT